MEIIDNRKIEIKTNYDVIVIGGGIAGISAAVSSSRLGAKTLLIEKLINLGGLAVSGLISYYEPLCDGEGNQIIYGIAEELIKLSVKYGFENLPSCWGGEGKNPLHYDRYATNFSPNVFSVALDNFVRLNGVDIRFDTIAVNPVMDKNNCIGIIAESVSNKEFYSAKFVIDASGDAQICKKAGFKTADGNNYLVYVSQGFTKKTLQSHNEYDDMCNLRKWYSIGGDMNGNGNIKNLEFKGIDSDKENEFIKIGKENFFNFIKSLDKHSFDISTIPYMPQFRKIRRIEGNSVFLGTDIGVPKKNSIGCCADFRKKGILYELSMDYLINSDFPNIITAGRIISSDNDGWEITRVIPVCALTGQSAGTIAALCTKKDKNVNTIDYDLIKNSLINQGIRVKL